ncbi:hypothetical protein [Streptomyces sp. NBC_01092]|uniref:hypothetical protein n=1 Tax=Streptomyces sp. NBC_01092 TaxID=2903748 RepID=UPI003866A0AD|nr:hypothetical protein OG254_00070 [Streptomyces sp. NBC_01092]WSU55760.1 hypothetical protein OG254_49355 [Streptomyces sp. NBC_01092]
MDDTVSIPADVTRAFTDAWGTTVITSDVATSLGCTEVNTLADLLRAFNAEQAADEWIDAHAEEDEPNDAHFQGTVPADASLAADGMRWSPAPADTQDER